MAKSKKKKKNKGKRKSFYDELINIIYNDSRKGYSIKNIVEKRKLTILDISKVSDGKTYIVELISKKIQNDKTNPDNEKILVVYFLLTTDDILENKDECILQKNIIITTITKRWFTFPNLKQDSIEKLIKAVESYNDFHKTNIATDFDINNPYDFYRRINELPIEVKDKIGFYKLIDEDELDQEDDTADDVNKELFDEMCKQLETADVETTNKLILQNIQEQLDNFEKDDSLKIYDFCWLDVTTIYNSFSEKYKALYLKYLKTRNMGNIESMENCRVNPTSIYRAIEQYNKTHDVKLDKPNIDYNNKPLWNHYIASIPYKVRDDITELYGYAVENYYDEVIQDIIKKLDSNEQIIIPYDIDLKYVYRQLPEKYRDMIIWEAGINAVEKENKKETVDKTTKEVIKEEVVARKKRKTRKRLTKELVEAIYADSQKGLLSYSDIAKMYSVSPSTVGRIANKQHTLQRSGIEVIFNEEEKDIVKELIEEPEKIITPNEPLVTVDEELMAIPMEDIKPEDFHRAIKYVRMGMVADRHNMPTNKYVFESISPNLMFDYDKMDKIAMDKVLKEVTDNKGNVKAGIALYVTGLTGALGSIAKACYDCKINLTLLHYNSDTKKYIDHPIYKDFIKGDILPVWFPNGMREVYTYKDHIDEFIIDGQIIYEVAECHFTNVNTKEYDRNIYLFLSKEHAWKYYNQRSYIAGKSNLPINIYLSKYYISNRSFTKEATLRKAINVI